MSNYQIRSLDQACNKVMLEILRGSPIETDRLTICFDRQPDIFALARCKYDDFYYDGLYDGETLKGFGMAGYHRGLVNGEPAELFCARDLYILPESRGRGFVAKSTENHFREHLHRAPVGYGVIMHGNSASLRFVGRKPENNRYSPDSRIINQLMINTIMLAWPVPQNSKYAIRRAQMDDIPEIVRLLVAEHRDRLFGHIYTEASFPGYLMRNTGLSIGDYFLAFDRSGKCCGVCAAWDMHQMKQTRILRYGRAFFPSRIAWKAFTVLFNRPSLPKPGGHFREVTITDYAARDRDPEVMNALLRAVYREYRQLCYHFMIWGSSADDPLLTAASGFMRQAVLSNIILFSANDKWLEDGAVRNHLPYIDISGI